MSQEAQLHDRRSDEDAVSILQTAKVFCCRDEEGRSVPFAKKMLFFILTACPNYVAVQVRHVVRGESTEMRMLRAESPRPLDDKGEIVTVHHHSNVTDDTPPPLSHPALSDAGQLDYSGRLSLPYTSVYDTFQALMNAEMLLHESDRLAITVHVDRPVTLDDGFEGLKCCFLSVLEWVHSIPEFVRLDVDNKNKLIQSCWCDLCTLQFAAHNRQASSALVLANGLSFRYDQIEDLAFQEIVDRTLNEVSSWLESMTINEVEIAHIKALLLFNSGKDINLIVFYFIFVLNAFFRGQHTQPRLQSSCTALPGPDNAVS